MVATTVLMYALIVDWSFKRTFRDGIVSTIPTLEWREKNYSPLNHPNCQPKSYSLRKRATNQITKETEQEKRPCLWMTSLEDSQKNS